MTTSGHQWLSLLATQRSWPTGPCHIESGVKPVGMRIGGLVVIKESALPCLPHLSSLIINESEAGALLDVSAKFEGADADINWNVDLTPLF